MIPWTQSSLSQTGFLRSVNDANGRLHRILELWQGALAAGEGTYALCLGSTATSDIEGISAAGADGEARRATPAIDAEALVLGKPVSAENIPVSPVGVVSPVVISRAMLELVKCQIAVYNCGAFIAPKIEAVDLGGSPANRIDSGKSMDVGLVQHLFSSGRRVGAEMAGVTNFLVVAECVPAGTTTALAVLTGLGYPAADMVSSSMPNSDRALRNKLVADGLASAGLGKNFGENVSPLDVVAAVGDPMQAFAAGFALEAARRIPVILGGGTQMLAVYALMRALSAETVGNHLDVAVVTTKWVAFDQSAGAAELAKLVGAPFAASCPNFAISRHHGLRAYEEGNVKEGVGAGALMAAASLRGLSEATICCAVDDGYERMVLNRS